MTNQWSRQQTKVVDVIALHVKSSISKVDIGGTFSRRTNVRWVEKIMNWSLPDHQKDGEIKLGKLQT